MFKVGDFIKVRGISVERIHAMAIGYEAARDYVTLACRVGSVQDRPDGKISYRLRSTVHGDWWVTWNPDNFYQDNECLLKDQS